MDRITVWQETQKHYAQTPNVESLVWDSEKPCPVVPKFGNTIVRFYNEDCIEIARRLRTKTTNSIMLLNMADWGIAGGLVEAGAASQEEELFRRSNLFKHLHQKYYPMHKFDVVVSSGVEFYREGLPTYRLYPKTFRVDVISSPAPKYPALDSTGKRFETAGGVEFMLQKIRGLLWVAYESGAQYLVLSAWGCGAFGCPPEHVGELFHQVVSEFDGCFKGICFAIKGPNCEIFKKGYGVR